MNWQSITFDWNQVRAFLVTAEEGSLSAAARGLGMTQPTLSRQVAALEERLGVTLFTRAGRSLILTDTGEALLSHVQAMGKAANAVALVASGQSQTIEGRVTITATDMMSAYVLPNILRRLNETAPGIAIDVLAANDVRDLERREADIALRNAAPTEPDLIARRLRDNGAIFCAAKSYLAAFGPIETYDDLKRATWVGYGDPQQMVDALAQLDLQLAPEQFKYNCTTGVVVWEMIKAGLGVGVITPEAQMRGPELVRLLPDQAPIPVPLYLISRSELHTSRRIRIVWNALAEALG